ncbi:MAG: hypothetical protein ACYSX1_11170 [Planctomycetota bacterium]|jgi:hypothetical protein
MGIFSFLQDCARKFSRSREAPWNRSPSIYSHIKKHIDQATGCISDEGDKLPDEERRFKPEELKWVSGGLDSVFGHLSGAGGNTKMAKKVGGLIIKIARTDSTNAKIRLYKLLLEDSILDYVDPALDLVTKAKVSVQPYLHTFSRFLLEQAPDRGPVKFGIALTGVIRDPDDLELVELLGRHEEFTLYSGVALANMLKDPYAELWELAKCVKGWGRIHLVDRLAQSDDPNIRDWLIREGYKNRIMYEYSAYTCATKGRLKEALQKDSIDDQLLKSSGEIISALISGGPGENIGVYSDAADVITSYLRHLEQKPERLEHFTVVDSIDRYLKNEKWDWSEREKNGWNEQNHKAALEVTDRIIRDPKWRELAKAGLSSEDDMQFYVADQVAERLKMDTSQVHWRRLQKEPHDSARWYHVMKQATEANIAGIVDYAIRVLPLGEVATGPKLETGFGPEFKIHGCLDCILQDLRRFPKAGWPLVEAGLDSPVTRNRNMALRVLSEWSQANWTEEMAAKLRSCLLIEPDAEVKARIQNLIAGKPLDFVFRHRQ